MHLADRDVGRPIETFNHMTDVADLWGEVRKVGKAGERFECVANARNGRSIYIRVLPYEGGAKA